MEALKTIEYTFRACGYLAGIAAAWFELRSRWLSKKEDRAALQEKYRNMWVMIRDGQFLELPERGILWFINLKRKFAKWSIAYYLNVTVFPFKVLYELKVLNELKKIDYFARIIVILTFTGGVISIWHFFGIILGISLLLITFLFLVLIIYFSYLNMLSKKMRVSLFFYILFIHSFLSCILIIKLSLSENIYWTALTMLALLPIFTNTIYYTISNVYIPYLYMLNIFFWKDSKSNQETIINLSNAISISLVITAIALSIGNFSASYQHVPQTLQMFLVNILFDGITLLLTYKILEGCVDKVIVNDGPVDKLRKYSIPFAIILDILVAALLACLSLYFGLLGTCNALSAKETVNVLIGHSPSGMMFEYGPYFWVMHTTFIPTLIYLSAIALAYIGKLIILPIYHVLKKGNEIDKPHGLTAATFFFVSVFFIALAEAINRLSA